MASRSGSRSGFSRFAGEVFEPVLVAFYSIPKITLYPILLLMFGLGMSAKVAFGAIHGIIPVALFTINAVRNVRPVLIKAGRAQGLDTAEMVRLILFPAAMPEIFTGLRIGFALTLVGTLLGEMFASQRGLGFLLMNAIGLHNIDLIMAITLLLVVAAADHQQRAAVLRSQAAPARLAKPTAAPPPSSRRRAPLPVRTMPAGWRSQ